jgi:hypothetical protein
MTMPIKNLLSFSQIILSLYDKLGCIGSIINAFIIYYFKGDQCDQNYCRNLW